MNRKSVRVVMELAKQIKVQGQVVLDEDDEKGMLGIGYGSQATGKLRRLSMDLTRALANMRKSG